jgi:protein-tyrosine phosphatase
MIDIHSHFIYGVDDGSQSVKESLKMILEAEKLGIESIIATPHFHIDLYSAEKAADNLSELIARVSDCGVQLYLGYEVFLTPAVPDLIKGKKNLTLNNSKYLLFELPFDIIPPYSVETVRKLHGESIIPILAHPERNKNFVSDFNSFISFLENGCLIQLDAASITGVYGSEVKKFAKKIIELKIAHFVASDAHCTKDYKDWYLQAYNMVRKWAGGEYADKLFHLNPKVILDDPEKFMTKQTNLK